MDQYPHLYTFASDIGTPSPLEQHTKTPGVSCVAFDTEQEIVWAGNYTGHVTSFSHLSPQLYNYKYTSFHVDHDSDVRQLTTCREGVVSLVKNGFRLTKRRGVTVFRKQYDPHFQDLQCMMLKTSADSRASQLYVAGNQDKLIQFDIETERISRMVDIWENDKGIENCQFIKNHPKFICLADSDGKVVLRDTNQLNIINEFKLSPKISSLDILGNYLVTCSAFNQILMIYDLREMKLVSATQAFLPIHIKFLSRYTTKCVIVSHDGRFCSVDITRPNNQLPLNHVQIPFGAELTSFDISSTNQAFAFGDSHNGIHIHGTCGDMNFNSIVVPPEYDDILPTNNFYPLLSDHYTPIPIISSFPHYAVHKMRDYTSILSHMPSQETMRSYRAPAVIPPELINNMRMVGNIGFVTNMSGFMPSLVNGNRNSPDSNGQHSSLIPQRYRFLEPNHNKVEMEQYDFSRFNHSPFPGLDSTMPNSYANNIIQCLYFIPQIRSAILDHLCSKEFCLLCEFGFLFHMLDIAPNNAPCQASNFLRVFRSIPEAFTLKLILTEEELLSKQYNLFNLTQQWFRFVLYQLSRSATTMDENGDKVKSFVDEYFPLVLNRRFQCSKCHGVWEHPYELFPITLNYYTSPKNTEILKNPEQNSAAGSSSQTNVNEYVSFTELLTKSILTEQSFQSNCEKCQKMSNVKEKRSVHILPKIFSINTGLDNERAQEFWKEQNVLFVKKQQEAGRNVVTSYTEFKNQNNPNQNARGAHQTPKPCRFMEKCNKTDCKFFHAKPLPNAKDETESEEEKKEFASYIPPSLFILNGDKGAFKISDSRDEFAEDEAKQVVEYVLVNISSIVDSSETTCGNVVSAIKIDPSYVYERKRMTKHKLRRFNDRNQRAENDTSRDSDGGFTDYSEDESFSIDDHDQFTNEHRNITIPTEIERCMALYRKKHEWYLFNHYSVNPVSFEEVISNDFEWKKPTILMYINKDFTQSFDNKELRRKKNPVNENALINDFPIRKGVLSPSILPFSLEKETITKGDIVGMDAEFVMLSYGDTELRSDGTRVTMKPSHKSVARISCVRGSGPLQGIAFIDDYISNNEMIVDFMTKYSGIEPADLDPNLSSKHLTTLKATYMKLRFLADRGVIFVGHGLRNDFRVINLIVPPEQVIDTVYLFQSYKSKRMVSLRFLAFYFLELNIQSETHDSIEDAKTALLLYRKYKELEENGTILEMIDKMYEDGRRCGWRVDTPVNHPTF